MLWTLIGAAAGVATSVAYYLPVLRQHRAQIRYLQAVTDVQRKKLRRLRVELLPREE